MRKIRSYIVIPAILHSLAPCKCCSSISHKSGSTLETWKTLYKVILSDLNNHSFILDQNNTCSQSPNPNADPFPTQRAQRLRSRSSQRKVVGIVIFHILRHPENDGATDSQSTL